MVRAALNDPQSKIEPLLILRTKRRTPPERIAELTAEGLPMKLVSGLTHGSVIKQLVGLCDQFKPDIFVAHGFSEHIWGRMAALEANVPSMVHVEHNTRERYNSRRLAQTHALAPFTDAFVGVSEGVKEALLHMGMPPARTLAIPNGINLAPFKTALEHELPTREPGIVMVARFSKQKDHITLLQALHILKQRGYTPTLHLAGGGGARHRKVVQDYVTKAELDDQVIFHGVHRDIPGLLMSNQVCVMATHWEGMPLALLEGMAAGCAVIASDVPGVREVIHHGVDGLLVAESDPYLLADALQAVLTQPGYGRQLGINAHHQAFREHGRDQMNTRYNDLLMDLFSSNAMASRKATARS